MTSDSGTYRELVAAHLSERERRRWCAWLRAHGIAPGDVAVPGWVERREAARQLVWLTYARNADGRICATADRTKAVTAERVLQLEARPLPFPA